ncbi:histamine H2 receptor-like [Patiria miniata]|uniref:G-protein coupled receptors family 1 profile domain-containing protein n=1 Tax=Patiria miniata TaxID=46514 RepID=A0A914BLE3_PATMI|nr:histamine H2 receptor-like [Patiria miniata]
MSNSSADFYPTSGLSPFLIVLRTSFITLLSLLIITGNIFSIVVTRRMNNMADSTKVLMTSLAVYDFLVGVVSSFSIFASAMDRWPFGDWGCRIITVIKTIVLIMSLDSILLLNTERYIAVTWPYKFPVWCTRRRTIIFVIFTSSLSCAGTIISHLCGLTGIYIPATTACFLANNSEFINILVFLFVIVFPMISMTLIYYRLIKISRGHQQRNNRNGQNEGGNIQDNKALKTFLVVTLTFVFCYTPYMVTRTVQLYTGVEYPDWTLFVISWLYVSNSAFNVFIYCLFNQAYRQMARRIISERFPSCKVSIAPVNI